MSEMVERVAKAIIAAFVKKHEGGRWVDFEEAVGMLQIDGIFDEAEMHEVARAAIDAIREPTEAMLAAARNAPSDLVWRDSLSAQLKADAASKYRAMIDAALHDA